ncbi:hypothetical protein VNO78_33515 [Psophocarpus tetragonolobus]|uniref:Uncharacterized protein n=1 Tax=Psophocarpus tetragonolobus TaxID=3891 RepID=A0AAN9P2I6_PSOTE
MKLTQHEIYILSSLRMEYVLALPAQKKENLVDIKKPKRKNVETNNKRKVLFQHDFQRNYSEVGEGNRTTNNGNIPSDKHHKDPIISPYPQNYYWKKRDNMEGENGDEIVVEKIKFKRKRKLKGDKENIQPLILDETIEVEPLDREDDFDSVAFMGASGYKVQDKEQKKPKSENKEAKNRRKPLVEHDFQRSGNEMGTENTKTNDEKRTSKKLEEVPKVSAYFQNDYRKKEEKRKEEGDEIPNEKIKSQRKTKLKKHDPQGDNVKNVRTGSFFHGSEGKGYETAIGKIESKQKRRLEHEPQANNEEIDPKSSCSCSNIGFVENMLLADGKIKSKQKKKKIEDKLWKNDNDFETSIFDRTDLELYCNGFYNGLVDDKLQSDRKIISKEKKKKKITVEDESCENDDEAETSRFILKKRNPQAANRKKISPELGCYEYDIEFVDDKLLADGKIISKENKHKASMWEHGDDTETSKLIHKKREYERDNEVKIHPQVCGYGCEIGFVEDHKLVDGKIKSKEKKKKKMRTIEDELCDNGDGAETSIFLLKKCESQGANRKKIDPELCCYGRDIEFVDDKLLANGKIMSKEKKKKAVVYSMWEHGDDNETNKFTLKKCELEGDNEVKIHPEVCGYGCEIGFVEDHKLVDGKITSKEKKKKEKMRTIEDELCDNGDGAETSIFLLKKCESQGANRKKIGPELCCYGRDIEFVDDKLLANGKIMSKEKKKKAVVYSMWGHGDDNETNKFTLKKCELEGDNEVKIHPEVCGYGCEIGFIEDHKLVDGKIKSKEKKKKEKMRTIEDELCDSGDGAETSIFLLKKCESEGANRKKIGPELCCYGRDIEFVDDKLLANGKIMSKEKKKKAVVSSMWEHGDYNETNKKCELEGDNEVKIHPEVCGFGCEIGFVEDRKLVDGKIKSKEKKKKKKKKTVKDKCQDGSGTSKVKVKKMGPEIHKNIVQVGVKYVSPNLQIESAKINVKPLNKESIKSEPMVQESCVVSVVLSSAFRDSFEDKLKVNGNGFESISIKIKKRKSNS